MKQFVACALLFAVVALVSTGCPRKAFVAKASIDNAPVASVAK